jgi:hypothetical protein
MYDSLSEFRTQILGKVRDLIPSYYKFSNHNDVRPLVIQLLHEDNFACPEVEMADIRQKEPKPKRFLADIIVNVIALLFFQNKNGLARFSAAEHMFSPIRRETVVLAATLIYHCLEEYVASGTRITNKIYHLVQEVCIITSLVLYINVGIIVTYKRISDT